MGTLDTATINRAVDAADGISEFDRAVQPGLNRSSQPLSVR